MKEAFALGAVFASAAAMGLLLSSCATLAKEAVAGVQNAALLTVTRDRRIDTGDFHGIAALANQLAQDEQFRLKPIWPRSPTCGLSDQDVSDHRFRHRQGHGLCNDCSL
jgi:uncharacterized protein YbbK (DUF523 family)